MSVIPLTFFEDSNHSKKGMLQEWVMTNIDFNQLKKGLPVCFYRNTSFYLTELPDFSKWPQDFKARALLVLVDADMKEDLERAGVINWCRNVRAVVPISVPKDGNCLLHSVGIAVWGILDSTLMLRKLLGLALSVDTGRRFYSRWVYHRQTIMSQVAGHGTETGAEDLSKEWKEISNCLDPENTGSVAVPHRFLESIHVYTLANILRRPVIIMTDPTIRAFSGKALQDNDMGGIYLPLEWNWKDTHKTPLLLGYSHNHFSPLLFADHPNQAMVGATQKKDLAPLVNAHLEQLPVRFLLQGEEPEAGELLRKYLKVKETVTNLHGTVQNILCAELDICNLPNELNLVSDFFREFYGIYRQEQALLSSPHGQSMWQQQPQGYLGISKSSGHQQMPTPQNGICPAPRVVREQLQGMRESEYALGDPNLQIPNPCGQGSVRIPPPGDSFGLRSVSLNAPHDQKCIVPSCKFYGDPDLAMMCSNCFKNYTIRESRQRGSPAQRRSAPSAPFASLQEEEQPRQMSMMTERCKTGCGFRCSTTTFPYCHECAEKRQKQAQEAEERARANEAWSSRSKHAAPGVPKGVSDPASKPKQQLSQTTLLPATFQQPADQTRTKLSPPASPTAQAATELSSPSQALAAASLSAPLTPPDDPTDLMLFASGDPLPEVSVGTKPLSPVPVNNTALPAANSSAIPNQASSTGKTTASKLPGVFKNQQPQEQSQNHNLTQGTGLPDKQNPTSLNTHQNQQLPFQRLTQQQAEEQKLQEEKGRQHYDDHMNIQEFLNAGMTKSNLAEEPVAGPTQQEPISKCSTPKCREDALHKNLCGKCYVTKGAEGVTNPFVEKLKMPSLNSTRSSAPASIGANVATNPQAGSPFLKETAGTFCLPPTNPARSSSLTHLPNNQPPLSANTEVYVQTWLEKFSKNPQYSKPPDSFEPKMGLPEKQEMEPLPGSGSDLLASGSGCYSATLRCMAEGCNNPVSQEKELCDQCKAILRQARQGAGLTQVEGEAQGQSLRTSVQESLPPMHSLCKTDGCTYCGNPANLGYCSRCYEKLFRNQQEAERRLQLNRRVSSPSPNQAQPNIRVPAEFHHVPLPNGRQGDLCRALGCNMYGDPKQRNMCFKHYQEYIANLNRGAPNPPVQSATYAPPSPRRIVLDVPYLEELTITPSGATYVTPGGRREVIYGAAEINFPQGEISVPPPSYPTTESGLGVGVRSQEQSLNETYNRVVGRNLSSCLNPTCSNYGNSSKGGLCNSCASNHQYTDDLIRRTMLGDEEIG